MTFQDVREEVVVATLRPHRLLGRVVSIFNDDVVDLVLHFADAVVDGRLNVRWFVRFPRLVSHRVI